MKLKLSSFLIIFLITSIINTSKAQKSIGNAIVEYDVTTLDASDSSFNMHSHLKYYYASDMLRIDSWYDDGSVETYFNGKNNTITSLQSGGGESSYYTYTPSLWKKKSPTAIQKFEALPEQKTIQGFKCKAAKVYYNGNSYEKIFYTEELTPQTEKNATTIQGILGFILEKQTFNKNNQLIQKATLVSFKETVAPADTFVPNTKGYTKQELFE